MDKYSQMKRFKLDPWIQVYMYYFIYVDPETVEEEEYFTNTKRFVEKYNRRSAPGIPPKHWIVFSHIFRIL